jgi:hypothetical protein
MKRKDSKANKNCLKAEIAGIMSNKEPGFRTDSNRFDGSFVINDFLFSKLIFL